MPHNTLHMMGVRNKGISICQLKQCGNFKICQDESNAYIRSKRQPSLAPNDGLASCQAERESHCFLFIGNTKFKIMFLSVLTASRKWPFSISKSHVFKNVPFKKKKNQTPTNTNPAVDTGRVGQALSPVAPTPLLLPLPHP